jgi:hypothetical protein
LGQAYKCFVLSTEKKIPVNYRLREVENSFYYRLREVVNSFQCRLNEFSTSLSLY